MTVKNFCSKCANWYKITIMDEDNFYFEGTAIEACYSKYAKKSVKQVSIDIVDGCEGMENIITLII